MRKTYSTAIVLTTVIGFTLLPTPLLAQIIGNTQIGDGNVIRDGVIGPGNVMGGPQHEATRRSNVPHRPKSPLRVVTENGDIALRETDRKDVQIVAHLRAGSVARLNAIRVETKREQDGTLSVSVKWPAGRPQFNDMCSFEILVPPAHGGDAMLRADNGDVEVQGHDGRIAVEADNGTIQVIRVRGDIDVKASNGRIEVTDASGSIKARAHNGRIQVMRVQGEVDVESRNGKIEVTDASGSVKAKANNGRIQITLANDAPGPIIANARNGSITLELGDGFSGQLDLSAPWGPIKVDVPGAQIVSSEKKKKSLVIGQGGQKSTATAKNGSIRVRRRSSNTTAEKVNRPRADRERADSIAEQKMWEAEQKRWEAEVEKELAEFDKEISEFDRGSKKLDKAKKELDEIAKNLDFEPGDEVVVLRDVELKVEAETVGTARKGKGLAVEDIQGGWLWVRSGDVRGWIDRRSVISAALMDWYRRLPQGESVDVSAQTRAKFRGVIFEIHGAGSKGSTGNFDVNYARPCTCAFYTKVMVFLEGRDYGRWALYLNFDHPGVLVGSPPFPAAFKGSWYGTVAQGDYVFVSTAARQVFVNGQLQRAR